MSDTIDIRDSNLPHVKFIDLRNNGIMEEVAVLQKFNNGDVAYIPISALDDTDKTRLLKIVNSEHARMFPLYELMKSHTLKNGVNALEYFHQLARVRTATGLIIEANPARRGAGPIRVNKSETNDVKGPAKKKKLLNEAPQSDEE